MLQSGFFGCPIVKARDMTRFVSLSKRGSLLVSLLIGGCPVFCVCGLEGEQPVTSRPSSMATQGAGPTSLIVIRIESSFAIRLSSFLIVLFAFPAAPQGFVKGDNIDRNGPVTLRQLILGLI